MFKKPIVPAVGVLLADFPGSDSAEEGRKAGERLVEGTAFTQEQAREALPDRRY